MIFNLNKFKEILPIKWGGTGASTAEEALSNLGGTSKKLLWTNAKPSSAFATQTISLDLSAYDEIQVEFRVTDSSDFYTVCNFTKGKSSRHIIFAKHTTEDVDTIILDRVVSMNANGVNFGGGTQKTLITKKLTANTGALVPIRIWGIKGVK